MLLPLWDIVAFAFRRRQARRQHHPVLRYDIAAGIVRNWLQSGRQEITRADLEATLKRLDLYLPDGTERCSTVYLVTIKAQKCAMELLLACLPKGLRLSATLEAALLAQRRTSAGPGRSRFKRRSGTQNQGIGVPAPDDLQAYRQAIVRPTCRHRNGWLPGKVESVR